MPVVRRTSSIGDAVACSSGKVGDLAVEHCQDWCSISQSTHHCAYCKCKACDFCRPKSEIDHIYASAGSQMAACDEGANVKYPAGAAGSEAQATLQQCKERPTNAGGYR